MSIEHESALTPDEDAVKRLRENVNRRKEIGYRLVRGIDLKVLEIWTSQKCEDRPNGEDCYGFALGAKDDTMNYMELLLEKYTVSDREHAELVAYTKIIPIETSVNRYGSTYTKVGEAMYHLGKLRADGKVESKWGPEGDVYIHRIEDVPPFYGDTLKFYKQKPSVSGGVQP